MLLSYTSMQPATQKTEAYMCMVGSQECPMIVVIVMVLSVMQGRIRYQNTGIKGMKITGGKTLQKTDNTYHRDLKHTLVGLHSHLGGLRQHTQDAVRRQPLSG